MELSNLVTEDGYRSKQAGVRRILMALVLLSLPPLQAAVPIRLQVIPYQVNNQTKPVLPVLLPPPLMINEQAQPGKRRRQPEGDWSSDNDFDWLMD